MGLEDDLWQINSFNILQMYYKNFKNTIKGFSFRYKVSVSVMVQSELLVLYESKVYSEKQRVVLTSIHADFAEKFWKDISVITDKKICTVKHNE